MVNQNTGELLTSANRMTGPIYHNPTFGQSSIAANPNWTPGQQSRINMDEPLFAGGSSTSLRDVLNRGGNGSYHDALPTYAGQATRMDPRAATKVFAANTPATRQPTPAAPSKPRKSSGGGGAEMLEGAAMGMGMGRAARKGHFLEAVELAGLHEHEGNNQKVIDRWVNK